MIQISLRADFDGWFRRLDDMQRRQLPFAAAMALNDAADAVKTQLNAEMRTIFDRPTPFTDNAVVAPSRASKGRLAALVTVRPIQAKYLLLEDTGGTRTPDMTTRKSARALLGVGDLKLNQFGNIPSGMTARLAKQADDLRRRRLANKGVRVGPRMATRSGVVYIKGGTPQAHGKPGGFFRLANGSLTRIEGFVAAARYSPRLNYQQRLQAIARRTFNAAMPPRLAEALRTAR